MQGTEITVSVALEMELNEIIHCDRQSPKCDIETGAFARIQSIVRPIIYMFPRDTYWRKKKEHVRETYCRKKNKYK